MDAYAYVPNVTYHSSPLLYDYISYPHCRLQFFLTTLRTPTKEVAYYIGIQVAVDKKGPGQMPSNPGKFVRIIYDPRRSKGIHLSYVLRSFD